MDKKSQIESLNKICIKCNLVCYTERFQQDFKNWTSDNNDIDKFIQGSQLSAHGNVEEALEWIPYSKFCDIEYIAKDKYKANWIDGNIINWNDDNQNWERKGQIVIVELRRLYDSKNITFEFIDKIDKPYGITQDPETENYLIVLNNKCKKCNYVCYTKYFQHNFTNWSSGSNDIDKFIQNSQLLAHSYGVKKVLEWIPYNKLYNIKYIAKDVYRANWTDGNIINWNIYNQDWKRKGQNIIVQLKGLNIPKNITLEFIDKIEMDYTFYGITQNPETKNYILVSDNKCLKCNLVCYAIHFQQNFENWTSGNNDIDKFIQDSQLSAHDDAERALEWIPYDKFYNIRYIAGDMYRANWIDGNIINWDNNDQDWKRKRQNIFITLKKLYNSKNFKLELANKKPYGITQNPDTKDYMMVLDDKCNNMCDLKCYAIHFQQNFGNWTSGNNDIDKFIQDSQLSAHDNAERALEWIPYNKFYNNSYIVKDTYIANWIGGNIINWDNNNQTWKRRGQNILVTLKKLYNSKNFILELANKINKPYGITQNPVTKDYMTVLADECAECNLVCYAIHFQQNFGNWTSGNNDIDKFIQDSQLSAHYDAERALEWIPYNKFYNIIYIMEDMYRANWIDGNIINWDNNNQTWKRRGQNILVTLKKLYNPKNFILELANKINKPYGITQNPETKDYMTVLADECTKCNHVCYAIHFQQNFGNWTSGNNDIDKFIQDSQLSAHYDAERALEWIPYNKFYSIIYITKDMYRANWIDGNIINWDNNNQTWKRRGQNILVTLKKLYNSKKFILELANKINKPYGITQNPETKDYMTVLADECAECNLVCYAKHFQQNFGNWTSSNDDIDKFIQDSQLSTHRNIKKAIEWISYDKLYDIKYIGEDIYRANWIDGNIIDWDNNNQNWIRQDQNMIVQLKGLKVSKNITLEFMDEIKIDYIFYGITQDAETEDYMMVLNDKCKVCKVKCYAIHFQQNFENWTSGNNKIDIFIQGSQLSAHYDVTIALEWIPYDKFYDVKCIANGSYRANWIDEKILSYWDVKNQNWKKGVQNPFVTLKRLNNPENIALELTNEINKSYGITQNPETKDYMMVLSDECKKCNIICYAIHFQQNFGNWTSGNNDIDKFIQSSQLSVHNNANKALEWIPYERFINIEYVAKGGFSKVYKANWLDGNINYWDNEIRHWKRGNQYMVVVLKSLNNSKNVTPEFINEV
ncbi:hypothetical protein RirG_189740 [Rhizophagus irregularis DAOM 197198w]|uniref:Protein kinase domain-containing protein n=2 Tax=Rhizophagus irregularis (strain DAOM 197198w) TaxID=1432141 RepID=A0A015KIA7_RHIIW|nr:hypothetical protein RirG_189740 [Rhizophagus irregularis DAOM 197198w]